MNCLDYFINLPAPPGERQCDTQIGRIRFTWEGNDIWSVRLDRSGSLIYLGTVMACQNWPARELYKAWQNCK